MAPEPNAASLFVRREQQRQDLRGGDRIRVACTRMPPLIPDPSRQQRDLERERALTALVRTLPDESSAGEHCQVSPDFGGFQEPAVWGLERILLARQYVDSRT
ncbi:hypothetical protein ACIBQ1_51580 [Nonomuraea sp. NPDC050153]|uniref:hypothetical protein n=1 Tax=Nonomuraea sp. NPDC050153 TaxID=3364359 RepID=UPI0037A1CE35